MDTLAFIEKILPIDDKYVLFIIKGNGRWNEAYTTAQDAVEAILRYDKTSATVYYAVGKFANNVVIDGKTGKQKVLRKKEYATKFKTLCCDIDVGDTYAYKTQKDAAKDILRACQILGVPHPMLVSSGYGLHCYWPLTDVLTAEAWETLSIQLRLGLQDVGVYIDASKIHDTSMVLRPPGSHNKKQAHEWKPVVVLYDQPANGASVFITALSKYGAAAPAVKKGPNKDSSLLAAVLSGAATLNLDDLVACNQIAALLNSGGHTDFNGEVVKEPLWRASLGIAKYCTDQETAIIRLAGKHPEFDLQANIKKLAGWKGTGPTTCGTFKLLCPKGCEGCAHDGKITSPAQLSRGLTEIQVVDPTTNKQTTIQLPYRYSIKNNCVVYTPPGSDDDVVVAPYKLWVVGRATDVEERRAIAKVAVDFPVEGTKVVDVDMAAIAAGGAEFSKTLALKQIYTYSDNRLLRQYLMTYLKELQSTTKIDYYYKHYGWQKDGTFLTGDGAIGKRDVGNTHLDGAMEEYKEYLCSKGDLAAWTKGTKLFDHPDLTYHGFVFMVMGGAVLMHGSGLASMFVNMYSEHSGSGKTLTARYGLSIWGKPSKLMRTVIDTDNALYKRFGILNSIGAYIDEITTMDTDRLRNFLFTLPEGRERDRVRQSADGFRDIAHWNMPVFGSSNRDIYEALGVRYSSEAEKLRILQLPFLRPKLFETNGLTIGYTLSKFLEENYGLAGPVLIKEILARGGPHVVYDAVFKRFSRQYGFTFLGPERFWQVAFVIAEGFREIATDLGLISFDGERKIREALSYVESLRSDIRDTPLTGLDVVMQYLTEHADKIVHWREAHLKHGLKKFVVEPVPKVAVARSEIAYDDSNNAIGGQIYINKIALKQWCIKHGIGFKTLLAELVNKQLLVHDNMRRTLYKGVPGSSIVGQTYCIVLDVMSDPRLVEAASGTEPPPIEVTQRMRLVTSS